MVRSHVRWTRPYGAVFVFILVERIVTKYAIYGTDPAFDDAETGSLTD